MSTAEFEPAAVLFVDDDEALLAAITRVLRVDGTRVLTAATGDRAIQILESEEGRVGAVISDYAMQGMNGAELLRVVRMRWPDATRILVTGNADLAAAARAVNEGGVSSLILKPWEPDDFRRCVTDALHAYNVLLENRHLRMLADQQAERLEHWNQRLEELVAKRTAELEEANASLQRGLLDTVRILLGFLEHRVPERAARCREIARLAGRLAERAGLNADTIRRVQVAALVHDIGLMGLPDPLLRQQPDAMPLASRVQYEQHPVIGQTMLSGVEQLVEIARWIRHHHERWDGRGYPDRLSTVAIPLPSRIIALADGYLSAVARDGGTAQRWRSAQRGAGAYDPDLLEALTAEVAPPATPQAKAAQMPVLLVPVARLEAGMRVAETLHTAAGAPLLAPGEVLTEGIVMRLKSLAAGGALASDSVKIVGQLIAAR